MIKLKIDVRKIDKAHLFTGAKGVYLDLALFTNKNGTDEYGNDGFIVQEVSKESRDSGEKGPIIGNWRDQEARKPAARPPAKLPPATPPSLQDDPEEDDIPF